jgi:hypothetical protein
MKKNMKKPSKKRIEKEEIFTKKLLINHNETGEG